MILWKYLATALLTFCLFGCFANTHPLQPDWIVDQADVLDANDENDLTLKLSDFYDSTGVALVGVTLTSLPRGESIDHYAESLYDLWELGNPETDNGILVLLLMARRQVHIAVGTGIAQALTSQVLDSIRVRMAKRFEDDDFSGGFEYGFESLIRGISTLSWGIKYTGLAELTRDSLNSISQILSAEGMIDRFEDDLVVVADSDGREVHLIVPVDTPILSVGDVIGFTGRILQIDPLHVQVIQLDADYAFSTNFD